MSETCRRLHKLGYHLESVEGLSVRHIDALVKDWYATGHKNKTMQNQYSRLKIFCGWAGKKGIMNPSGFVGHLPDVPPESLKVQTYAEKSKSWSGRGVDVIEALRKAREEDTRWHAMLLMGVAFGLRKKEMLRIKPHRADKGFVLEIDGAVAKNGRFRSIPIAVATPYGDFQRFALDSAKGACGKQQTLGWPERTFKQNENRFYTLMKKCGFTEDGLGITGHGLRAEFTENQALLRGLLPPTLGGKVDQTDKGERERIAQEVAALLGHGDRHTIGAYYGLFRVLPKGDNRGARVGSVIVNAQDDTIAGIFANPAPVADRNGKYRKQGAEELVRVAITVVVEKVGSEDLTYGVAEIIGKRPDLALKIGVILASVGLGGEGDPGEDEPTALTA